MKRKYIDADKLIAEIKRLIRMNQTKNGFPAGTACALRIKTYESLISFLDTLQQEQPEAPVVGEVHHVLNCHYLTTDNTQLCARLREFPEGAKVDIFIIAKEDEKP